MRNKLMAALSALVLLAGIGWYSVVHAQTAQMSREEPHMSAALGHLQEARAELEKATPNKGGHRERAMQLVDQAIQQVKDGEKYYEEHRGK
jgi:uncharacterized protein HemX